MSWKQNNGRDRGHIDGIGYFLKGPNNQQGTTGPTGPAGGGGGGGGTGPTGPASTVTGPTGPASTVTGPTGPASTVTGPTGPASTVTGPTGPASTVTGPTGPASTVTGPTGPASTVTGPTGHASTVTGPTGPASTVIGPTGPDSTVIGPTGYTGYTGPTGPASTAIGPTGYTGPAGTSGVNSITGGNYISVVNTIPTSPIVSLDVGFPGATGMMLSSSTAGVLSWKSSIGYNQTWKNSTKTAGTLYTNITSMPILVCITIRTTLAESTDTSIFKINGVVIAYIGCPVISTYLNASFIIPPNNTYQLVRDFYHELFTWSELS